MFTSGRVAEILDNDPKSLPHPHDLIQHVITDTRKIENPQTSIFFALSGSMHDGHEFVQDAIKKGVRNIVISKKIIDIPDTINVFKVKNVLRSMQKLVACHRDTFTDLLVIGITGSNGKTTIKEWLYQMIHDRQVVKSPKSYNSQTGVSLSVWQIKQGDQLGIFEAGISQPGEMQYLQPMIKPQIGLFTMIGDAHADGFKDITQKLEEKLILFKDAEIMVFDEDDLMVSMMIKEKFKGKKLYSWGWSQDATLFRIRKLEKSHKSTHITVEYKHSNLEFVIPFTDLASVGNAMHCIAVMLILNMKIPDIKRALSRLYNIPMRLEMKNGIQGSLLVNDTYNADLQSFKIALEFLAQQAGNREKLLIISDFMQTGLSADALNVQLADLVKLNGISKVYGIGKDITGIKKYLGADTAFLHFPDTNTLIDDIPNLPFDHCAILVKGARVFQLEKIIVALSEKVHTATLETDLQAIDHNIRMFSEHLSDNTRIIAVIKASAYGSGSEELAKILEYRKVAYLAVAYIDEGIQLRKAGIKLPVIILNPDSMGVATMMKYNLEPEVYCMEQLHEITSVIPKKGNREIAIHIKLDTGMHRLGFVHEEIDALCQVLGKYPNLRVKSVFSHLSSSEDPHDDDFTHSQVQLLNMHFEKISSAIGYFPFRHILNSAGIIRFPQYHFDLVRLGLGLYGIDSTDVMADKLQKVHTLKANVIQIKNVNPQDSIGYNRKGKVEKDGKIAIINIGYADGLLRMAGNGKYFVRIHHKDFPITGNVCMDLTIVDIGDDTEIRVGDEVIIFGKDKPIEDLAAVCHTIPYEILTRISPRIKRVYIQN